MIYILFGEMGVGKNYLGEKIAKEKGILFVDGDELLPFTLKEKVKQMKPLTPDDVANFVEKDIIPFLDSINDYDLVFAQALYNQAHRDLIESKVNKKIKWIHVKAPSIFTHIMRLLKRKNGLKWVAIMLASKPFFQESLNAEIIINRN